MNTIESSERSRSAAEQVQGLTINEDEAAVPNRDVAESGRFEAPPSVAGPAGARLLQMVVHGKGLLKVGNVDSPTAQDLSAKIWSKLPDEVIDLVLAWLPIPAFFRMRCVCRKWNHTMFSPSFLAAYSRVPIGKAIFLSVTRLGGVPMAACHDAASSNRWQRLPLDSVPVNAHIHDSTTGLLCCERLVNAFQVLSVCNPLTKKWRDLPPVPNLNSGTYFVKMIPDSATNSYKIIRVGWMPPFLPHLNTRNIELCTEVYDSKTDSWTPIEHTPTDLGHIRGCSVRDAGSVRLQCWTSSTNTGRMMAFDMSHNRWTAINSRNLDTTDCECKLVNCNGQPYLVTQVKNDTQVESIDIWGQKPRHDPTVDDPFADVEWEKIDRISPDLFQQWSSSCNRLYNHVGVGDHIYSTCLASNNTKLITYSTLSHLWQLIDGCPTSQVPTFLGGFEFRPRLDAAV